MRISDGIDPDLVDLVGLRQHGHRARGGVDAPLRFRFRHALHAMAAGLELELRVRTGADDAHDRFLVAAEVGRALGDHLGGPAMPLGKAHVHAQQVTGEQRRLVAAGAGADLEEDVAIIVGVLRQQQSLQVAFDRLHAAACGVGLFLGQRLHVRIGQHLLGAQQVRVRPVVFVEARDHGLDFGALLAEGAVAVHVARRVLARQLHVDLLQPAGKLLEFGLHRWLHGGLQIGVLGWAVCRAAGVQRNSTAMRADDAPSTESPAASRRPAAVAPAGGS